MMRSVVEDRGGASRRRASAVVGMVGGGQLARMSLQAAISLGVHLEVLAASADDPAVLAGASSRIGDPSDLGALLDLAADVDVVTFDHELVPPEHLRSLEAAGHRVHPSSEAMFLAQDKAAARGSLAALGVAIPPWEEVRTADEVASFAARHGWPVVLKAARGGYDGRGVVVAGDLSQAAATLDGNRWVAEAHVDLAMELAVVVVRRPSGEVVAYPVVETVQEDGMCREVVMPVTGPVAAEATSVATSLVERIDAVGVVAVELFLDIRGRVLVNELALRPHNSGHPTIEANVTSQFENHLRAVLDWPLGDTAMVGRAAAMVNVVGSGDGAVAERLPRALAVAGAHPHIYGKEDRLGRKLGHVTVVGDDPVAVLAAAREAADRLMRGDGDG